ncbi:MAG TPA: hypothetical protein QF644_04870, partial [Candidatus Poseidoniaceae archaeon]|nr:hypothetical protein [Candidatus Poseidoniaceae archaeon]
IIHWLDDIHCEKATLETTNENKLEIREGLLEKSVHVKEKQIVQLERIGYAKLEATNELIFLHD